MMATASDDDVPDVLTAREAAKLLRVNSDTLYDAAGRGELPHRRIGRRILFSRVALLEWLRVGTPARRRR